MKQLIGIVWFRQDLRVRDNIALAEALKSCDQLIPVYVFDKRLFSGTSKYDFKRIGVHRAQFLIDSIIDLRHSLKDLGTDLIVRYGNPDEVLYELAAKYRTNWVFCNRERTTEEVEVQDNLEQKLWSIGQEMRFSRGKMLYHTGDLPFPVTHTPDTYASFYREVGKILPTRPLLPKPDFVPIFSGNIDPGEIPKLEDLGFSKEEIENADFDFKGGESMGLNRLEYFIEYNLKSNIPTHNWEQMRNSHTTHLAPYISFGCISAKTVFGKLVKYKKHKKYKKRVKCLIHGLIRRDFYRLMAKKYNNSIFKKTGIKGTMEYDLKDDIDLFSKWAEARTGVPMVDAFMRELHKTGYVSPEGRFFIASFLVEELGVNWQIGAEYFESKLIDYDPSSNWVNWNHIGGVSLDSKEDRYCNIVTRAKKIDPKGDFIREWVPELAEIANSQVHEPYKLDEEELDKAHLQLGKDYPAPIVDTEKWI